MGLLENPFVMYPDARYFVPCVEHLSLYQGIMRMSVESAEKRIAMIMGEDGTGKTTLAKRLANSVFDGSPVSMKSVLITEETPTPTALVRRIIDDLGVQTRRSLEERLKLLNEFVINNSQTGSGLFLVIDTDLDSSTFNTLLEILHWTDVQGFPLAVKVVVFSRENIFKYIESKPALRDIVGMRQTLGNLSFASASNLIESRVRMAGRSAPLFQPEALNEIIESTNGNLGSLLSLADQAFALLLDSNDTSVSLRVVMEAQHRL